MTDMENVQKAVILLMDQASDQRDTNTSVLEVVSDITKLLESMDASNALLEARVQMLEAQDGS